MENVLGAAVKGFLSRDLTRGYAAHKVCIVWQLGEYMLYAYQLKHSWKMIWWSARTMSNTKKKIIKINVIWGLMHSDRAVTSSLYNSFHPSPISLSSSKKKNLRNSRRWKHMDDVATVELGHRRSM